MYYISVNTYGTYESQMLINDLHDAFFRRLSQVLSCTNVTSRLSSCIV